MKPRILITMHYLELGGAETALIGLLHALDPKRVDVDLYVYSHQGEMMRYIPEWVNLLPEKEDWAMFERPMKEVLKKGHLRVLWARLKAKWETKQYMKILPPGTESAASLNYAGYEVSKVVSDINPEVEYDLAIAFVTPHWFTLDHVRAKKKVCWIHTDYSHLDINKEFELPMWSAFDHIISISDDVTRAFLSAFPTLKDKIVLIENILPKVVIESRSLEDTEKVVQELGGGKCNSLKILTIGRFCEQKNLDNLPFICKQTIDEMKKLLSIGRFCEAKNYDNVPDITRRMIESGCDVRWYIIGYGDDTLIRQKIAEAGMEDHVIILGKRENPYPYIKACDIYVQPSRYEGKSVTVREAQVLCKPVVITNYPTAHSQINDGVDGVIVPLDNEGCAKGLAEFILDEERQQEIIKNLQNEDHAGMNEVEKIYELM